MLTGQRRTDVLELTIDEVDFDERLWRLPPERTKNRRAHDVPLSRTALDILRSRAHKRLPFSASDSTPVWRGQQSEKAA
jgi:integrase